MQRHADVPCGNRTPLLCIHVFTRLHLSTGTAPLATSNRQLEASIIRNIA